jgi:serine protease Do
VKVVLRWFAGLSLAFLPLAYAGCESPVGRSGGQEGFAAAVLRNAPAVVQIIAVRPVRDPLQDTDDFDLFQPMAGLPLKDPAEVGASERSFASGFVFDADGWVLTSAHAVFDAMETWVLLSDGRRFLAAIVGLDRRRDIALLKVQAKTLPAIALVGGRPACAGDWVAAIGAPFGFSQSVTAGIVSAYPRMIYGGTFPLIQTDVAINPGSSGGPLFGSDGALLGMSSMIYSASGIYIGVSFAVPAEQVARVAAELRSGAGSGRGDIGISTQPVSKELALAFGMPEASGALVTQVAPGGPGDRAGLGVGDILLSLDRGKWAQQAAIEDRIAGMRPGSQLLLEIWRRDGVHRVTLAVEASRRDQPVHPRAPPPWPGARLGLGLAVVRATAAMPAGVYVESVAGASLLAGLERGDRIMAVNDVAVASIQEFDEALQLLAARPVMALLVKRGSASLFVPVVRDEALRDR